MTLMIVGAFLDALRPAPKMLPSAWAEANLNLPQGNNARPGALRLTKLQRGMIDAIDEPDAKIIVYMLSAQSGKSTAIDCILASAILNDPGPCLHVSPTESKAFAYVRERLDPLIAASPALRAAVGAGTKGVDSKSSKSWPGGSLAVASSFKNDDLASKAIKLLLMDEIDRFSKGTVEGSPIDIALARTKTFNNARTILASTPTWDKTSKIAAWIERSDKRKFFVECPDCHEWAPLDKARLHFTPGNPAQARLACLECGALHTEAQRLNMVRNGEWRATAIGEPGVVGFMANELSSEFSSLARVAAAVDGADTLNKRRVLENLTWGLPFSETSEISLQPGDLQARAEAIAEPYPSAITTIVAATDVQSDRLETTFLASSKAGERWILDHVILMGDVSGRKVWDDLDALLSRTFKIEDGRELPVSASICDAGFQITAVSDHVTRQRAKGRRAFASIGRAGFDRATVQVGSQTKGARHRLLILGVDNIKLDAQKALTLPLGTPGAIHLPDHLESDYFDQLASERLESNFVRGYSRPRWTKDASVRNESFDTLVYALAVTTLVKTPLPAINAPKKPATDLAARVARLQQITA